MRSFLTLLLSLVLLAQLVNRVAIAQQPGPSQEPDSQTPAEPAPSQIPELKLDQALNLVGCAGLGAAGQGRFTVSTTHHNLYYRYLAKGLEGHDRHGVHIVGAFLPTTDIAAQAGSIDPTITAMATASGNQAPVGPVHVHVRFEPVSSPRGSCPSP
jgi:hypothetical protein